MKATILARMITGEKYGLLKESLEESIWIIRNDITYWLH